jgi:hypothetical protein
MRKLVKTRVCASEMPPPEFSQELTLRRLGTREIDHVA